MAFRLALGYGVLVVGAMAVVSTALYFGTVVTIDHGINAKVSKISERLIALFEADGVHALHLRIVQLLTDGIDQDTEVYALLDADGRSIVGNIAALGSGTPFDRLTDQVIVRGARPKARAVPL